MNRFQLRAFALFKNIIVTVSLSLSVATASAATDASQVSQAMLFFQQVLHQTQNPVIAGMAQRSLMQLRYPDIEMVRTPLLTMSAPLRASVTNTKHRTEIPLIPQPDHALAVSIQVSNKRTVPFLVDTGATYTVITPQLARQIGVGNTANVQRIMVMTANGTINAPLITIPHLSMGTFELNNVRAVVADLGRSTSVQGLLGMDVFKNMALTIQSDRIVLSL